MATDTHQRGDQMTTDPFDNLQYALRLSYELMKKDYEASPDSGDYVTGTNGAWEAVCEALAALDSIRDRYLPLEMLPEGWAVLVLAQTGYKHEHEKWRCVLCKPNTDKQTLGAYGKTPNAAFLAAVKAIGE